MYFNYYHSWINYSSFFPDIPHNITSIAHSPYCFLYSLHLDRDIYVFVFHDVRIWRISLLLLKKALTGPKRWVLNFWMKKLIFSISVYKFLLILKCFVWILVLVRQFTMFHNNKNPPFQGQYFNIHNEQWPSLHDETGEGYDSVRPSRNRFRYWILIDFKQTHLLWNKVICNTS